MSLGVTDIDFEHVGGNKVFALPREVLRSETLTRLSVSGCRIVLGMDPKISCPRLKSLNFHSVGNIYGMFEDIFSSCPLIENLSLDLNWLPVRAFYGSIGLHKLKCLFLGTVCIDALFFCDFSSKFPCLKDLSIHLFQVRGHEEIQISSTSLECISIHNHSGMLAASFDVPRLRKFMFKSSSLPKFSFKKYSREWKSDISVVVVNYLSTSWFIRLKEFLAELSQHEISLSLSDGDAINADIQFVFSS